MHRFYIEKNNIQGNVATIIGQDAKHLVNVLRLKAGTKVILADGDGTHYISAIKDATSKMVIFNILERQFLKAESPAHITIAQAMLKDKKMDTILRYLTELGIKEWIPFFALRSVPCPKSESKFDARVERWQKIAKESIKQCGRSLLPIIHAPISFDEIITISSSYDEKVVFWEKATTPVDEIRNRFDKNIKNRDKIIVMIGPEGGFSEDEIDLAQKSGFKDYTLGSRILRAETATIAASTLIQNIFGDLGS
ncbi:MAG: 16S rRNA (uracil(1498)-N(3))-methyltransferase [Desulfamplus sp.]|nr:16S rRNA (uracil(1498)-N(3))-methyltransferase [Desulfamplus sp.]